MGCGCFLCGFRPKKGSRDDISKTKRSLHGLPSNEEIRFLWIKVCGLAGMVDENPNLRICSAHFNDNDYIDRSRCPLLKSNAVPSVSVPHPLPCVAISEPSHRTMKQLVVPTTSHQVSNLEEPDAVPLVLEPHPSHSVTISEPTERATEELVIPSTSFHEVINLENGPIAAPKLPTPPSKEIMAAQVEAASVDSDLKDVNIPPQCAQAETSAEIHICGTPKKRRFNEPRYVNEITVADLETPRRRKRYLALMKDGYSKKNKQIKQLQDKNRLLQKRIKSLQDLVKHLRDKGLMSEEAGDTVMEMLPEKIQEIVSRKLKGKGRYSAQLRSFALTLHFYSPKAYNYVRKCWQKLLPHPSTIRQWYRVVDGAPGFTTEALHAITLRAAGSNPVLCNLVIDEMSIREQVIYDKNKFHGGVDFGTTSNIGSDNDNITPAKNALVFMAVALNSHWKVPIGYFLIKSLNASERANLLNEALKQLSAAGAHVFSITFDGASSNLSMCTRLGANLTYGKNFKPFFLHPITKKKVFIFLDLVHMIKLIRNALGDKEVLKTEYGDLIKWEYIVQLYKYQIEHGLRAANKLTQKHIMYGDNRMNAKVAMQTLSESVCKSLMFLNAINDHDTNQKFAGCLPTAIFCLQFNNIADMLNCKNVFSNGKFNKPLNHKNYKFLKEQAIAFENYIVSLRDVDNVPILNTVRKTGFLGLIVNLRNMFSLFDELKQFNNFSYLLTYKLSQDYLETFFSAIRSRGGFNNNPNALQFKSAYKRLLVRHELKEFENGNCLFDDVDILHISSKKNVSENPVINYNQLENSALHSDHDYVTTFFQLSPYVEEITKYIAGYVTAKLLKIIDCYICRNELSGTEMPLLSLLKNWGPYVAPAADTVSICKIAESVIRQYRHHQNLPNLKQEICNKIARSAGHKFNSIAMENHIKTQDYLDNHRVQLCSAIIEYYVNVRLFHDAKSYCVKDKLVRHKYHKLILFNNQ